jgi:hypothetical protein
MLFFTTDDDESTADYIAAGMHGKAQTTASAGGEDGSNESN